MGFGVVRNTFQHQSSVAGWTMTEAGSRPEYDRFLLTGAWQEASHCITPATPTPFRIMDLPNLWRFRRALAQCSFISLPCSDRVMFNRTVEEIGLRRCDLPHHNYQSGVTKLGRLSFTSIRRYRQILAWKCKGWKFASPSRCD